MEMKIKSIKKIINNSKKYDIQVANNHNFYANNILVHNCSLYYDYYHTRSLESNTHESQHWIKNFHANIKTLILPHFRICGENVYAQHSIKYSQLPSYFLAFSVWNEDLCLSWDDTTHYCNELGIKTVNVLYRGIWNESEIKKCYTQNSTYGGEQEGYVVRLASEFYFDQFKTSIAKFVRANHVTSNIFWRNKSVIKNGLKL